MYYRTDQIRTELIQIRDLSDTGVPVGTTGLIQIQDLSDTGVPVGTTEQIKYGQNLFRYGTYQIQEYP